MDCVFSYILLNQYAIKLPLKGKQNNVFSVSLAGVLVWIFLDMFIQVLQLKAKGHQLRKPYH